jgi:hypothetical protein
VDTSKLGVGEAIAGISGLALFIFLFLPWYGVDSVGGFGVSGGSASAWEALSFVDILLFLISVIVVGLVLAELAEATPQLPQPVAQIITIAGVVALLLVLFRLIFTPGVDTGPVDVEVELSRKIGVFLASLAAAGIVYGGWRASNEAPDAPTHPVGAQPPQQ